MKALAPCVLGIVIVLLILGGAMVVADDNKNSAGNVIQFGTMHEAIGQDQHQGRVGFAGLLRRPHFFGVAALEDLQGETTVFDGKLTVTTVDDQGQLLPGQIRSLGKASNTACRRLCRFVDRTLYS